KNDTLVITVILGNIILQLLHLIQVFSHFLLVATWYLSTITPDQLIKLSVTSYIYLILTVRQIKLLIHLEAKKKYGNFGIDAIKFLQSRGLLARASQDILNLLQQTFNSLLEI
ncbi:hypothetical protein L9F63_022318, partial [Diploptera punctata]